MAKSAGGNYKFDSELAALSNAIPKSPDFTQDTIHAIRAGLGGYFTLDKVLAERDVSAREVCIDGPHGSIVLSILSSKSSGQATSTASRPSIFYIHGGGLLVGTRFFGLSIPAQWVVDFNAVCVSVEYRLAPEHAYPIPAEDCLAAFKWMHSHAGELGIDPDKIVVAGTSAGGGLAAATCLMLRDQGGPQPGGQMLFGPMLDNRLEGECVQRFGEGVWSTKNETFAWRSYLGEGGWKESEHHYAAPGRVANLAGLPSTFVDVAYGEIYRDPAIEYVKRLAASGGGRGIAPLERWVSRF